MLTRLIAERFMMRAAHAMRQQRVMPPYADARVRAMSEARDGDAR